MAKLTRNATLVLVLASMVACTEMPVIKLNAVSEQRKLSSASHWRLIADDLVNEAAGVSAKEGGGRLGYRCVRVGQPLSENSSRFQVFLADAIAQELVSPEGTQDSGRPSIQAKPPVAVPASSSFDVYRSDAEDIGCDEVTIQSQVIQHSGPPGRPYPGQYTLLATGLLVVRNVAKAFSVGAALGAVAAGEVAFWASSGFRSSDTVTELTITISRVTTQKMYVAQFTNVYYINSGDAGLYEQDATKVPATANIPPEPKDRFQARLRAAQAERARRLKPGRLIVEPRYASACGPVPRFFVTGSYLSPNEQDYMLDSTPAHSLGAIKPEPTNDDTPQTVQVVFTSLKNLNMESGQATLSTVDVNGKILSAHVYIDDASACAKAASPPAASTAKKPTGKKSAPDVKFAQKGKLVGDAVNLCASPVELVATEEGGAELTKVQTADGKYEAAYYKNPGESNKLVTFSNFPRYSEKSLPGDHMLSLNVTLAKGQTLKKSLLVTCDPQKPSANDAQSASKCVSSCK